VATITDVAKRAGVARSTVSRALNESDYVSQETRERVLAAVKELNYVPNVHAERLRRGMSGAIAFVSMNITNPFWTEVARGVDEVAWEQGYDLVLYNTAGDSERERATITSLGRRHVDGAIFPWIRDGWASLKELEEQGVFVVVLGPAPQEYQFDTFTIDNVRGGRLATEHLLQLGHRRIAFIASDLTRERERGYMLAMEEHGLAPDQTQVVRTEGSPKLETGSVAVRQLLDQGDLPTAVSSYNDMIAFGAWKEFEKHGLDVPGDVSLIGFDDIPVASLIRDGLTTIALPHYEYGRRSAEFLLHRIAEGEGCSGKSFVMQPRLVIRGSTRHVRDSNRIK